jgi:hypothetical protein
MSDVRKATDQILEMVEEGILDKDIVIMACLKYMSEDDVADMAHCNEFFLNEEEESEFTDEDGNPISEEEQGRADAEADRLDKGEDQ